MVTGGPQPHAPNRTLATAGHLYRTASAFAYACFRSHVKQPNTHGRSAYQTGELPPSRWQTEPGVRLLHGPSHGGEQVGSPPAAMPASHATHRLARYGRSPSPADAPLFSDQPSPLGCRHADCILLTDRHTRPGAEAPRERVRKRGRGPARRCGRDPAGPTMRTTVGASLLSTFPHQLSGKGTTCCADAESPPVGPDIHGR
jgi:hypothetical protein